MPQKKSLDNARNHQETPHKAAKPDRAARPRPSIHETPQGTADHAGDPASQTATAPATAGKARRTPKAKTTAKTAVADGGNGGEKGKTGGAGESPEGKSSHIRIIIVINSVLDFLARLSLLG